MIDNMPTIISATNTSETPDIQAMTKDVGMKLGPQHEEWCMELWSHGAKFVAIPSQIPSKGMGMVAARKIKAKEQIVSIPKELLFTTNSILPEFKKRHTKLKVHALFALALACEKTKMPNRIRKWIKTWPAIEDLQTSMPVFLDAKFRQPLTISSKDNSTKFCLLPPAIAGSWIDSEGTLETEFVSTSLLSKQETKLKRDLAAINENAIPAGTSAEYGLTSEDLFVWLWLIVNTRSFYYDMPLRSKPKDNEDKICLCPIIDYFNHAEQGCNVHYNDEGFQVIADRDYEKGDEVVISYGAHDNDLLWTDYGFLLSDNSADGICIDAWMLDPSTGIAGPQARKILEDAGYWRNYIIGRDGPCYRTEMAIRTQTLSNLHWQRLARGEVIPISEAKYIQDTHDFLKEKVLKPCISTAKTAQNGIQEISSRLPPILCSFALQRWKQIQIMAENCLMD